MNKYVIYTSLTGGYDELPQYEVLDDRFDYICFSNDYPDSSKKGQWEIRKIPINFNNKATLSRFAKLQPHIVLPDYEYSIWIDSNITVLDRTFYDMLFDKIAEGGKWYGIKHPLRDCIYDEIKACLNIGLISYPAAKRVVKKLNDENFPTHIGLFENNLILRRHNNELVKKINEEWWSIFLTGSKRDQLSLFYIFWKEKFCPQILMKNNTRDDKALKYLNHISNKKNSIQRHLRRMLNSFIERIFPLFQE